MDLRAVEFAHDLKMPIQLIYSCVQLLEMEVRADSRAGDYLKMLMQSAHQLQAMVTNALDEDRLRRNGTPLFLTEQDLVAEVRSVCRRVELFAREKCIRLDFASNVAELIVIVDAEKLDRILHNLLSNALKFTPEGGRVSVQVQMLGDTAEISVSDTGCGIAEADRPRVFNRDYTTGGYGHGLAIVREYARMLGGAVSVHANDAGGSCFVLRLPVMAGN